ncbi:MAG: hypothetical protein RL094_316 [Candidatus Parcubacteria bacterium]|jgi:hypothetical protein
MITLFRILVLVGLAYPIFLIIGYGIIWDHKYFESLFALVLIAIYYSTFYFPQKSVIWKAVNITIFTAEFVWLVHRLFFYAKEYAVSGYANEESTLVYILIFASLCRVVLATQDSYKKYSKYFSVILCLCIYSVSAAIGFYIGSKVLHTPAQTYYYPCGFSLNHSPLVPDSGGMFANDSHGWEQEVRSTSTSIFDRRDYNEFVLEKVLVKNKCSNESNPINVGQYNQLLMYPTLSITTYFDKEGSDTDVKDWFTNTWLDIDNPFTTDYFFVDEKFNSMLNEHVNLYEDRILNKDSKKLVQPILESMMLKAKRISINDYPALVVDNTSEYYLEKVYFLSSKKGQFAAIRCTYAFDSVEDQQLNTDLCEKALSSFNMYELSEDIRRYITN